ncbi:MAG: hypothetical protein ACOC9Z_06535 [Chloroflexota bacterium]
MKGMKVLMVVMVVLALFGMVVAPHVAAAQAPAAPVQLTFDKSAVAEGMWEGTVGGDVDGDLTTVLTALEVRGPIWHVEFDWIVDAGAQSFTAHLSGILNTNTGKVVMNGNVVDGWLLGAQVHEEGQLVDPDTLRFQGTIQIMPETAN